MARVGFELTTPVFNRAKTAHALDRADIKFGKASIRYLKMYTV
jgi:hypothetical protein